MAESELQGKLQRRINVIEEGHEPSPPSTHHSNNPASEFHEFSRKQISEFQKMFKQYDVNGDKFIDFEELKHLMEKNGSPQTHLALKAMIKEVDEDMDSKINFREFLLIFRKAAAGQLSQDSGLLDIYKHMPSIDVGKEGVGGAKNFFQAKINEQTEHSKWEQEIIQEQQEKKQQQEEKKQRHVAFKEKSHFFQNYQKDS